MQAYCNVAAVVALKAEQRNIALVVDKMIDGFVAGTEDEGVGALGGHTRPSSAVQASQFDRPQKSLTSTEEEKLHVVWADECQNPGAGHGEQLCLEEGRSALMIARRRNRPARPSVTFETVLEAVFQCLRPLKVASCQAIGKDLLAWRVKSGMLMLDVQWYRRPSLSPAPQL